MGLGNTIARFFSVADLRKSAKNRRRRRKKKRKAPGTVFGDDSQFFEVGTGIPRRRERRRRNGKR
jgi:hypothetical protein